MSYASFTELVKLRGLPDVLRMIPGGNEQCDIRYNFLCVWSAYIYRQTRKT